MASISERLRLEPLRCEPMHPDSEQPLRSLGVSVRALAALKAQNTRGSKPTVDTRPLNDLVEMLAATVDDDASEDPWSTVCELEREALEMLGRQTAHPLALKYFVSRLRKRVGGSRWEREIAERGEDDDDDEQ